MASFDSLFEMLTSQNEFIINRPFDLFDEQDIVELFALLARYCQGGYSVNVTLMPQREEHRKTYCTGSPFMDTMQSRANGDVAVLVHDVIHFCKRNEIPMILILCIY